jgi:hypothetical protein
VALACGGGGSASHGENAKRFLAALDPSARECVANAIPADRLESTLESLTKLPHEGPLTFHDLEQLSTCAGPIEVRQGIARAVLGSLPEKDQRLMIDRRVTLGDIAEIERRFARFPRKLAGRHRAQGFERRGPARFGVAYALIEVPETTQTLMVDDLTRPGQNPPEWTAGELVAYAALEAGDRLVAAGIHDGVAWARITESVDGGAQQVITWGESDGTLLYRASGVSRDVLAALIETFRSGGTM